VNGTVLHGLGSSTTFYEACLHVSRLSQWYRVVRYDNDGHGLSPLNPTGVLSIESLTEDLIQVIGFLGINKVAGIVAHSMSALVATTFAAAYPDRVDKLCARLKLETESSPLGPIS
jgi:pimeloyl-ACP methyl ester carboxylesterase